jgi:hypothetical protein
MDSVSVALRAVAIERWLSNAALLSILAVPILALWLLRRWSAGRRAWQASLIWVSGCFTTLMFVGAAFVFAVCWGGETGEPGAHRLVRAYGTPVVDALEAFHHDSGAYPRTLPALVPRYLSPAALTAPDSSRLQSHFEYRADSGSFELSIRYYGPGVNRCRVGPGRPWSCSGYF